MRQLKISQSLTNRDSQAVEKYLQEVNKLDMITPEEEVALAIERRSHKEGSKGYNDAVESLTKANLRFVVSVAKQYQNRGLSLSDLINEGNLGLIKAAQRFDESKGFKFISYAVWRIRQSILQSISEIAGIVRMPSNKVGLYNKSVKVSNDFQQQFEREPSIEELAEIMDTDIDDIKRTILSSKRHISLDEPLGDETDSTTRADMLVSDTSSLLFGEFTSKEEQDDSVQRIIHLIAKKLSNRQSDILLSYFGVGGRKKLSYEELADKYDTSIERIRQIKEKALNLLRKKGEKMYNKTRSIMNGTENVYENTLKNEIPINRDMKKYTADNSYTISLGDKIEDLRNSKKNEIIRTLAQSDSIPFIISTKFFNILEYGINIANYTKYIDIKKRSLKRSFETFLFRSKSMIEQMGQGVSLEELLVEIKIESGLIINQDQFNAELFSYINNIYTNISQNNNQNRSKNV